MKKTLFALLWIQVVGVTTYAAVILAMIYGWGLEVKSWLWIFIGYGLANNMWLFTVIAREYILKALGLLKQEKEEA